MGSVIYKVCPDCCFIKPLHEFYIDSSCKDGHGRVCSECAKKKSKEYYDANRDEICKKKAEYAIVNKDRIRKVKAKYYQRRKREDEK